MIDLHMHILPGIDDGPDGWEDALEMAEISVQSGVIIGAATVHSGSQISGQAYMLCLNKFRSLLQREKIPLTVCSGMEVFAGKGWEEGIRTQQFLTLNRTSAILVEFPPDGSAREIYEGLFKMINAGYVPVLAHPERYRCVREVPAHVYEWHQMGAVIQMNKGSVTGEFGPGIQKTADILLRHRVVSVAASDAHGPYYRSPRLDGLDRILSDSYGPDCARILLYENPKRILAGQPVLAVHPIPFNYQK